MAPSSGVSKIKANVATRDFLAKTHVEKQELWHIPDSDTCLR